MSCQIKGIANLVDPTDIRNRLLGDSNQKFDNVPINELPLQNCFVSLSPAGDILAIAWNTRLLVLASKWDSEESSDVKNKFHIIWDGVVTYKQNEWITSVICLPLIAHGKTSAGIGADWTCLAIGLNTGFIKFYTETGGLLLEEQLHNESIINIKCQSYCSARHSGDTGTPEEIYILYNTVVCILQGFPLFSTLRAYRNHLARVKANCNDQPPAANLVCKKWGFKNQDFINDCEVVGSTSVNTFDHLMTASICGGYNASYRSSAPQHSLVMATGKRPFIGFHYALEGGSAPVLSDVAIAMASKVASAIGAAVPWLRSGGSKTSAVQEKAKGVLNEPMESMTCRFGLSDVMREGDCIVVSPNKWLSVVCDAMGRVILVDNKQGVAIRMWKGYRDAQCGWIEATEDKVRSSSKGFRGKSSTKIQRRTALFLVIYAPKKGVIDIWSIQHGTKITTFSASKNGRLLYTNYGLCGLNTTVVSGNRAQHPCIFIDPLGGIREITVPFHFALNSQNSSRARDMHLLKKLKTFLKEEDFNDDRLINEITNVCLDLKKNEIRLQTIEMLMTNKNITPDALLAATNCFSKLLDLKEEDDSELATKTLIQTICQLKQAIKFYKYIRSQFDQPPEYNMIASDSVPDEKQLSSILFASEREVQRILKLSKTIEHLKNLNTKIHTKVTFKEDGRTFLDFLSCFEFGNPGPLGLQKNITHDKKVQISKLIFQGWMYSNDPISKWQDFALNSDIQPGALIQFALLYWLTKKTGAPLEIELINFTKLLNAICSLIDAEEICASYNEVSGWWKDVRNILMNSDNPFNALTAAMACRAVSVSMQRNKDRLQTSFKDDNGNDGEDEKNGNKISNPDVEKMDQGDDKEENSSPEEETVSNISDWENVSKDTCQFSLLIGNLEDITILDAVVSNPPVVDETTPFYTVPYESTNISLGYVLSKGKGSVSEIVAKWLSSAGVNPAQLIDTTDIEFDQLQLSIDSLKFAGSLDEAKAVELLQQDSKALLSISVEIGSEAKAEQTALVDILDKISLLKKHFPYSLTSSVLLANLTWEFVMSWHKDITQLEALEAALSVLRQIPLKRIRHGVCCLLWSLHLKKRMESAGKIINKLGKLPKERLCMQDVGLSDTQVTMFLQNCVTFLDIFIDTDILEDENYSFIRSEELWEGHFGGPQPFAILAISQTPAWYDLLLLHLQLSNVLHMIAYFNLKVSKAITNLFDSLAQQHFFQDISDKVMIPWYKDEKRDNARVEFLCRVITASMESIHQATTEADNFSSTQAILWMSRCQNLASTWKINSDELRIHQVCQLYINGFDRLAEEIVIAVNDTEKLATNLLSIAGGRMMAYLAKVPNLLEETSRISPALTTYLQGLSWDSPSLVFTNCSNDDTVELIKKIARNLPETHKDYHIAQLMLDATFIYEGETSQNLN